MAVWQKTTSHCWLKDIDRITHSGIMFADATKNSYFITRVSDGTHLFEQQSQEVLYVRVAMMTPQNIPIFTFSPQTNIPNCNPEKTQLLNEYDNTLGISAVG